MSKPTVRSRLVGLAAALGVAGGSFVSGPSAQAQEAGDSSCVTGLSLMLDAVEVGSSAGPPIVFSTGISVVGIALPPADSPVAPVTGPAFSEFATAFRAATTALSEGGVTFAQQMRSVIEPLSAGTEQGDLLAHQMADVLDGMADTFGPAIQPADRSMHQTSAMLRISSCS